MCSLWKKDDLRTKPTLVEEGYGARFSSEPAGGKPERRRSEGSEGIVCEMHSHAVENRLISFIQPFGLKIAALP
jgi:hypothetical protein